MDKLKTQFVDTVNSIVLNPIARPADQLKRQDITWHGTLECTKLKRNH